MIFQNWRLKNSQKIYIKDSWAKIIPREDFKQNDMREKERDVSVINNRYMFKCEKRRVCSTIVNLHVDNTHTNH